MHVLCGVLECDNWKVYQCPPMYSKWLCCLGQIALGYLEVNALVVVTLVSCFIRDNE